MKLYFTGGTCQPGFSEVFTKAYGIPSKFGFRFELPPQPFGSKVENYMVGDVTIDDFKLMVEDGFPFGLGKNTDTVWIAHIERGYFDINDFNSPPLPSKRLSQDGAKEGGEQKVAYVNGIYQTAEEAKAFLDKNTFTVHSISELKDNIVYFYNKEFDILIGRDNAEDADLYQDIVYKGEFPEETYPLKGLYIDQKRAAVL